MGAPKGMKRVGEHIVGLEMLWHIVLDNPREKVLKIALKTLVELHTNLDGLALSIKDSIWDTFVRQTMQLLTSSAGSQNSARVDRIL
jgi:hypothetical protein